MKKLLLIMLALMITLVSVNAELNIDLEDVNPNPVEPGEKFFVDFMVYNMGNAGVYEVKLFVEDPFYLEHGSLQTLEISGNDNEEVTFRVDVEDDASELASEIRFAYRLEGTDDWITEDFLIDIDNEVSLQIISVSSDPQVLKKGEKAELKIILENDGDTDLEDIKVELDLFGLPLAPYTSVSYKEFGSLDARDLEEVSISIVALDEASSGYYKIPIRIEYEDENGKDYQKTSFISVRVGALPEIDIIPETNYLICGQKNLVDLKIINKGMGDAEFLEVDLYEDITYNLITTNKLYIGQVDSDDYETLTYEIFVGEENVDLKLYVMYEDDSSVEYKNLFSVPMTCYTAKEAKEMGLIDDNNNAVWGILVFIVVVGFFVIRRIRKKRRIEEE